MRLLSLSALRETRAGSPNVHKALRKLEIRRNENFPTQRSRERKERHEARTFGFRKSKQAAADVRQGSSSPSSRSLAALSSSGPVARDGSRAEGSWKFVQGRFSRERKSLTARIILYTGTSGGRVDDWPAAILIFLKNLDRLQLSGLWLLN